MKMNVKAATQENDGHGCDADTEEGAVRTHKKDDERPDQIELLFDAKRPQRG